MIQHISAPRVVGARSKIANSFITFLQKFERPILFPPQKADLFNVAVDNLINAVRS